MKNRLLFIAFAISQVSVFGQIGGKNGFQFINFPANARLAGVGGMNVSILDSDPSMMFSNPALLNSSMEKNLALSYMRYYADISNSQTSYVFNTRKAGIFGVGLQYTNYGSVVARDATGSEIGSASASDILFNISKSHTIGNFTLGANLKFANSNLVNQSANMVLVDMGGVFKHPKKQITVGLLIKNAGFAFSNYVKGESIPIPFDVQLGSTFKPEHMPLRFSVTFHHLHRWDISYNDPNKVINYDLNGNPQYQKVSFADNLFRHVVLGGELILTKGFHIRGGYNHFLRREMALDNYGGFGGFSVGAMLRVKAFEFGYTYAGYHPSGPRSFFTFIVNFDKFRKPAPPKDASSN